MSLSISIPKTAEQIPLDGLLTLARTAVGLGIGMLVADKIRRPIRQATAIALVSVGALAAVPLVVKAAVAIDCARSAETPATRPKTTTPISLL